jgi:integrase
LAPVLDFAERAANVKRWPLAIDIDTEFVTSLRAFLFEYRSTRNGRLGGQPRMLSGRQVTNILQCLRTALHWARSAEPRILPADWVVPLTPELVGKLPLKNPVCKDKLPLETRVALVDRMDCWQLCQLIFSVVLPLRPDEAAGLLISDVNFEEGWLEFGARFHDRNFTKARTAFNVPFPEELLPVLRACIGRRTEGPLLRSRAAFKGRQRVEHVATLPELDRLYQSRLLR